MVARELGLRAIGVELSEAYARASVYRVGAQLMRPREAGQLAEMIYQGRMEF
jgi:hypothetical protein